MSDLSDEGYMAQIDEVGGQGWGVGDKFKHQTFVKEQIAPKNSQNSCMVP